jgi:hypothetical protein
MLDTQLCILQECIEIFKILDLRIVHWILHRTVAEGVRFILMLETVGLLQVYHVVLRWISHGIGLFIVSHVVLS